MNFSSAHTADRSTDLAQMLEATKQFHLRDGFAIGTKGQTTMLRKTVMKSYNDNTNMPEIVEVNDPKAVMRFGGSKMLVVFEEG